MKIVIPTYRRVNAQHTLRALPLDRQAQTVLVVDEEDAERISLAQRVSGFPLGPLVMVHPPEVKTIAQKRAWILANGMPREWDDPKIVMMDDDLRFAVRKAPDSLSLREATPTDLEWHLQQLEHALSREVPHVGWSARQGNNNHGTQVENHGDWAENTRTMYVLGYYLPIVQQACQLGRIETREDMDYALQLLRAGHPNAVSFAIACDQKYNAPGGCSTERSVESSNADADRLAELHPGLVRVTEKKYKASIPRREVVVYWKKAYSQALAVRKLDQVLPDREQPGRSFSSIATTQQEVRLLDGYCDVEDCE